MQRRHALTPLPPPRHPAANACPPLPPPLQSELVWRELSAELDFEDPLAAAAAAAARAAASQPESTVPPGVAARLRTLLPGLNRATLMVGSQTAVLALPPPEGSFPSGSSSCSLSLPLRAAAAQGGGITTPHRGNGEGEGEEEEGSITFELDQPPNASLLRLLERFARLLSRRLGAERQHLAKAQLEVGGGARWGSGSAAAPLPCCLLCCCATQARSLHLQPEPYALSCRAALLPAHL